MAPSIPPCGFHRVGISHLARHRTGFTLIELLVVLAIVAALAVVVIMILQPAELFKQSRDTIRLSDLDTLNKALGLFQADLNSSSLGAASTTYVSIADPTATSTAGDHCEGLGLPTLPSGWSYHCAATSTVKHVDGTGWIPVNFTAASTGSPLGSIPTDPTNTSSSRLYYTYTTDGSKYELTAAMESAKYKLGGSNDVISGDGGTLSTVYEKGTPGLEPLDYGDSSLIRYWTFDEGSGSTVYDYSGSNASGTIMSGVTWVTGKVGRTALSFPGTNSAGTNSVLTSPITGSLSDFTINVWADPSVSLTSGGTYSLVESQNSPYTAFRVSGGVLALRVDSWGGSGSAYYALSSGYQNQWVMFTAVWNSSAQTIQFYVNGVLGNTTTGITSLAQNLNWPTSVAQYTNTNTTAFNGILDDLRVYNRALSAAEVAAMYAGGK
ncbi:MAG TPA: LamG domain-containing protein [Bryobacteraceae bacterium]|nr:LamG domain-containing protein [Bryobacteraceae bacterium]